MPNPSRDTHRLPAALLVGEWPTWQVVAGAVLVALGALLVSLPRS